MDKYILILLLILFSSLFVQAQVPTSIKGKVVDNGSGISLNNSVITLLHAKDSILVEYSRAHEDGSFSLKNIKDGNYILMVTYSKYTDFVEKIAIDSANRQIDVGNIEMLLLSELLDAVVITGSNAITIKGDTIEFDASKYTIQPNSKVEDLLAQLPGIQIDKDGKITTQGETVSKVLVDGEEFFGDDPTLVTKNIRGDMVDKVQLYDKKSDQATFTGIDDGEKTKTINIQLKEDSKNGLFGKAQAGIANDELYETQFMFNKFNGAQKFAAYGTIANTGKTGLSWMDTEKYSSSNNVIVGDGMIMITSSGSDGLESFDGNYGGRGIPLAHSGGAHYDTKWNNKKESINANYKIGDLKVDGSQNTLSQNVLPNGVLNNNANEIFDQYLFRQKADVRYDIIIDTTSTLKVSVDGTLKDNRNNSDYSSSSFNEDNDPLNQSKRKTTNEGKDKDFNASVLWNKKLQKEGRTLSVGLDQAINQNNSNGLLLSENEYYKKTGELDSIQTIDQKKENSSENLVFNSNVAYTEPLTKALKLALNYRFNLNNSQSSLLSYNQNNGSFTQLDSAYSNDFKLNQLLNQVGLTLNYTKAKSRINIGFSAANVDFKQADQFSKEVLERSFINYNPNVRWDYKISNQQSVDFSYNGNTSQPSITQLQPVQSNADPLNITIGNPDLDPSFRHNFYGGFNSYKPLSGQFINIRFNGSMTQNSIISNVFTDDVGKSIYRSENFKDKMPTYLSTNMFFGNKLKSLNIGYGGSLNYSFNSYYNISNDKLNETKANNVSFNFNANKYEQSKYSVRLSGGPLYTSNVSSLQQNRASEGWGFNASGSAGVYLPGKFEINTDLRYSYSGATQVFDENFERLIWNARLEKKLLKKDELILSLQANDILNQNTGFNRNAHSTGFTQTDYTTISRYFMFSIIWDFNKMGPKSR